MKFVHPEILYALAAVAIPIIVHLFNFRKFKKVRFSNVAFLREVKHQTKNKSKLKHLLALLTRIAAITCIVFAFAQPYIPVEGAETKRGDKIVSIYVDNSFSMEAKGEAGTLLELAKNEARNILDSYAPTDKFQLVNNTFEGLQQRVYSREEIDEMIDDIVLCSATRTFSEVLSRQEDVMLQDDYADRHAYLISDFQKTSTDLEKLESDSLISVRFVPLASAENTNVYIDSIWFESPLRQLNQPDKLNIRIKNSRNEPVENVPLKLTMNGVQKSLGSFNIQPGEVTDTSLTFSNAEAGMKHGTISIEDYPVTFDDELYFGFDLAEKIKVLDIVAAQGGDRNVRKVFDEDPSFGYTRMGANAIDFGSFATQNLIVINQISKISTGLIGELTKFADNGGSVVVLPAKNADIGSYNDLLVRFKAYVFGGKKSTEAKVTDIDLDHYLYKDLFQSIPRNMDLPVAQSWYPQVKAGLKNEDRLLTFQGGQSFLSAYPFGNGKLFVCAVSLDAAESNFARHALFVASMLRMAEFSQPSQNLYQVIGRDENITLRNTRPTGDEVYHISDLEAQVDFIPEVRPLGGNTEIYLRGGISEAGNYNVTYGQESIAPLALNFNREESKTACFAETDLADALSEFGLSNFQILSAGSENLSQKVAELNEGKTYWKSFIIWTLIFLALEILILKFWRRKKKVPNAAVA